MTTALFNRRMRKTACPVVWKGHGAQSPWPHPISAGACNPKVHDTLQNVSRISRAEYQISGLEDFTARLADC